MYRLLFIDPKRGHAYLLPCLDVEAIAGCCRNLSVASAYSEGVTREITEPDSQCLSPMEPRTANPGPIVSGKTESFQVHFVLRYLDQRPALKQQILDLYHQDPKNAPETITVFIKQQHGLPGTAPALVSQLTPALVSQLLAQLVPELKMEN